MKIEGSVAVVTGANRGIGKAFVEELLKGGARRVYATARDVSKLAEIEALGGGRVVALRLDTSDPASIAEAAKLAEDVTLLINNAGTATAGSQLTTDLDVIQSDFATNYFGTLRTTRAFLPALQANKGAIVNVLSVVSLISMSMFGGYAASKAAAHSLTLGLRGELAPLGVSVYGAYPGPVDTDMAKGLEMPKTSANVVAQNILNGIERDEIYIFPDAMAEQVYTGWKGDHRAIEAQFASM